MARFKTFKDELRTGVGAFAVTVLMIAPVSPASAAPVEPTMTLVKCDTSYGSVALTDGDTQGWTQFNLSSPRTMLATMIQQSGCFTVHNSASGIPADFLISAVAGSKEEIDKTMDMAKGAIAQTLVRSGVAGQMVSRVPMAGALFSAFGGLGGKKKTISAGLRIVSPANGQLLISGTGESSKSTISIINTSNWVSANQGSMGQYAESGNGKMMSAAFLQAYNNLVAQAGALQAPPMAAAVGGAAVPSARETYVVANDTSLWAQAKKGGTAVRALRANTELTPTGQKNGLFVEVADKYGTKGWVSVEDLR